MKKNKVTNDVMKRVIRYERTHTYRAIEIWSVVLLGFVSVLIMLLIDTLNDINQTGASDLIKMVLSDWGLAKEYGELVFETLKYDLPWFKITLAVSLSFVIGILVSFFLRRIDMAKKKWSQMKKYLEELDR